MSEMRPKGRSKAATASEGSIAGQVADWEPISKSFTTVGTRTVKPEMMVSYKVRWVCLKGLKSTHSYDIGHDNGKDETNLGPDCLETFWPRCSQFGYPRFEQIHVVRLDLCFNIQGTCDRRLVVYAFLATLAWGARYNVLGCHDDGAQEALIWQKRSVVQSWQAQMSNSTTAFGGT